MDDEPFAVGVRRERMTEQGDVSQPGSERSSGPVPFADGLVLYEEVEAHIVRITLNRPDKRNAMLTPVMNDGLHQALVTAQDDDLVKAVVLTGAGSHFCSGEDLSHTPVEEFGLGRGNRLPQSRRIRGISKLEDAGNALLFSDKTVIAACPGGAVGLGFRLALCSDIVVAGESSFFARPQSRIGLAGLDMLLPVLLLRLGINRGYELLLTGRRASAAELHEWGFVASVVKDADLQDEALRYARAIAAHSTDGLMIGRQAMRMFWEIMGLGQYQAFGRVAHPLFTNLVWRDDETNLFKERAHSANIREALDHVYEKWADLGFE